MALFRRRDDKPGRGRGGPERRVAGPPPRPETAAVAELWAWWTHEGRALAEAGIEGRGEPDAFAAPMSQRVRAVGALGWELAPGTTSEHVLVLTAEGDLGLRALARRAVLAAPEPDGTWSFLDSRPPVPDLEGTTLQAAGVELDLGRVQVGARVAGTRFEVAVHHPALAGLEEDDRSATALLVLEAALGEDDVEIWIGEVTGSVVRPIDAFGLGALRAFIDQHKREHLDADGQPGWVELSGETAEGPLHAMTRAPLHPLTAPQLDTHVAVLTPYDDRDGDGLPGPAAQAALESYAERLRAAVGRRGALVAHVSVAGVRAFHLYLDPDEQALRALGDVVRSWPEGQAEVSVTTDPGWEAVAHLRL